jgi:hypothetical protein
LLNKTATEQKSKPRLISYDDTQISDIRRRETREGVHQVKSQPEEGEEEAGAVAAAIAAAGGAGVACPGESFVRYGDRPPGTRRESR